MVRHYSVAVLVEFVSEEDLSTAVRDGVSGVYNYDIKALVCCLHDIVDSISNYEFHSLVLESPCTQRRHMLFTLLNHYSIDVNHD